MTEKVRIPHILGDGAGEDIWNVSREVLEETIIKAYGGTKEIEWIPLLAGQRALDRTGSLLPEETVNEVRKHRIALKGPLATPVGGGFRSVNVHLRQVLDLYVSMRPIRYFRGLPSPLRKPEHIDLIIFRENTEDLYRGIEWKEGSEEALTVIEFLREKMGVSLSEDTGVGVKPMSRKGTERFTKWVVEYAIRTGKKSITVVHKGNIMKFTEGAFREWAYGVARRYRNEITFDAGGKGIFFDDRIADNMFMQVILFPGEYNLLLCPNLNGDYLSDACAALVGGLGVAPGANIGDDVAIFEPAHGTAPKYAGKDMVNPTSFLLSGAMLFEHAGLQEAAGILEKAIEKTIENGIVTYDLALLMDGVRPVKCSEFGEAVKECL